MRIISTVLLSILLFGGCKDGDFKGFTMGQVKTVNGVPIANAEIHILYPDLEKDQTKSKPSAVISFLIPQTGQTTLDIHRFGTSILIEKLVESELPAGKHSATLSESLYTNGVYEYDLSAPNLNLSKRIFVLRPESELLNGVEPLATSNNSGNFTFQTSVLGIGEKFNSNHASQSVIVPSKIEFIAIKETEIIARKTVRISNGIDNEISLIVN